MQIPIFPLTIVIFPNSKYPLHIFEERYKKLINKCIADKTGFGIVSTAGKTIADVGVYVTIENVLTTYESGELDIIVKGIWRFKRIDFRLHPDGYNLSEVEKLEDTDSGFDPVLFTELKDRVKEMLKLANYDLNTSFWVILEKTKTKSFKIAEKSGLSITQQQELLTMQSENNRLNYLLDHFNKLEERLESNRMMREIILGDGFIN
jgi:ATP-dependent Lon protease